MIQKLQSGIQQIQLQLSESQIFQLETYIHLVLEFNKSYNLMKAETEDELSVNHILDSLVAVPHLQKIIDEIMNSKHETKLELADIGSGGGCPGIPLAIAFPQHHFTLVERMEKRCDFLSSVIAKLELQNVDIECKSIDMIEKERFDVEVFRAFHPFDLKITNLLLRMLKKNGYLAAYKARNEKIISEMENVQKIVKKYEKIKMIVPYLEDHERHLVLVKKI